VMAVRSPLSSAAKLSGISAKNSVRRLKNLPVTEP
jgi:hypothetical protein